MMNDNELPMNDNELPITRHKHQETQGVFLGWFIILFLGLCLFATVGCVDTPTPIQGSGH